MYDLTTSFVFYCKF